MQSNQGTRKRRDGFENCHSKERIGKHSLEGLIAVFARLPGRGDRRAGMLLSLRDRDNPGIRRRRLGPGRLIEIQILTQSNMSL